MTAVRAGKALRGRARPAILPTPVVRRAAAPLLALAVLAGAAVPARAEDTAVRIAAEAGRPAREVLGFLPYWELADPDNAIAWDTLTEVAYFGVHAGAEGELIRSGRGWDGWVSPALAAVRDAAHANGVRLTLTIQRFSWSAADRAVTVALLNDPAAIDLLAAQIAGEVVARGADGVNLDVEPIPLGSETGFLTLVREVRAALDAIRPGLSLTFDVTGNGDAVTTAAALAPGGADAALLMGYDFRTASARTTGSISPLGGPDAGIDEAIDRFVAAGVPPERLILGVPYYGRVWTTADSARHVAPLPRPVGGPSDWSRAVLYHEAIAFAERYGALYDGVEQSAWTTYPKAWPSHPALGTRTRQLWFDNVDSLRVKYGLVLGRGLRGIGIWALGYDDGRPELAALIREQFLGPGAAAPPPVATDAWVVVPGRAQRSDSTTFAPDGDGLIESAQVFWATDVPVSGTLDIRRGSTVVRTLAVEGQAGSMAWDGRGDDGSVAPVGRYVAALDVRAADGRAGLAATPVTLLRTLRGPAVTRSGYRSRTFSVQVAEPAVLRLLVLNDADRVVRTAVSARSVAPGPFRWTWNGRTASGTLLPGGRYRFLVEAVTSTGRQTHILATRLP